jgi:hypothetical protein
MIFAEQFNSNRTETKQNLTPIEMKKFIYILVLSLVCAVSFTSCTEEEVAPSSELENGGGTASEKM